MSGRRHGARLRELGLLKALRSYLSAVDAGADPIEALSGHLCGPGCWHWPALDERRRAILMKAPWNQ